MNTDRGKGKTKSKQNSREREEIGKTENKNESSEINPNNGFDLLHSTFTNIQYNSIYFIPFIVPSTHGLSKRRKAEQNRKKKKRGK